MTLEECISKGVPGCHFQPGLSIHYGHSGSIFGSHVSQLAFFCGMQPECDALETEALLNMAKEVFKKRSLFFGFGLPRLAEGHAIVFYLHLPLIRSISILQIFVRTLTYFLEVSRILRLRRNTHW